MRILWPHNYDPGKPNAGIFMFIAAEGLRKLGVKVHLEYLGNLRNPISMLYARNKLNKMAGSYDLIHAQFGSACALATAGVKAVPKVLSLRGSDWNTYNGQDLFYYWHTRMARLFTKHSVKHYDLVIAVSQRIRKELVHLFPNINCITIPDPINLDTFTAKDKTELRNETGSITFDEKWVLFNSNSQHNPIKRYDLAKKAIELASEKNDKIRLKIASNLPHDKIPDFVAACDLILCTSTAEGWPNSVKEALACNIPFVSTDVSDLAEISSKESVCKVCPPNPEILADAILDALNHPHDYNLRKYVEMMEIEKTSQKLLDLYEELLLNK